MNALELLLVEDNPGDVGLVRKALQRTQLRHTLHVARNGEDALDFVRMRRGSTLGLPLDLIFLDLNLPRMDGCELLRELKAEPALASIPVVVMTGSTSESHIEDAYQLQAHRVLTKPPTLRQLQRILARTIRELFAVAVPD